ncbi:MAG: hypothetical protein WD738_21585 [Pirellulales bacterium]
MAISTESRQFNDEYAKPDGIVQINRDLRFVFGKFPVKSLVHFQENRHRLIRGKYSDGDGGCLFFLLSEPLAAENRIASRSKLTEFFTGGSGEPYREYPAYQPARRLVRAIDGMCPLYYDGVPRLSWALVFNVLDDCIQERTQSESQSTQGIALQLQPQQRGSASRSRIRRCSPEPEIGMEQTATKRIRPALSRRRQADQIHQHAARRMPAVCQAV